MKKIFHLLVFAVLASTLQADFLWWNVGTEADKDLNAFISSIGTSYGYDANNIFVHLMAKKSGSDAQALNYNIDGGAEEWVWVPSRKTDSEGYTTSSLTVDLSQLGDSATDLAAWTFYVEVVNDSSGDDVPGSKSVIVGMSEAKSYTDLLGNGAVTMSLSGLDGYAFSSYVVPEPTSALMLLLGMGALALRRRRV